MADVAPSLGVPIFDLDEAPPADLGLSIRFHQILRRRHLDRYRLGVVNLHGAPLPEMRGSFCELVALLHGEREFGASLHWVDEGIDTGDLLATDRFPIDREATPLDLVARASDSGLALIKANLDRIVSGELGGRKQAGGRIFTRDQVLKMPGAVALQEAGLKKLLGAATLAGEAPRDRLA